jgi:hypothetical protein
MGHDRHGRRLLTDAAERVASAAQAILAVPALIEIATAQADAGCPADVAATLTMARAVASGLDRADDRDQALSQIAQSWAVHGNPERAVDVARDIGNEDRAGEALVTAALAIVARDRGGWPAATAIIDGVTSPEGEPRARTQRAIIEVAVASGDYEVAVRVARGVTSGRSHVLSELTSNLAARGAAEAVKSLLKDCAQEAESAYAACLALAHAVPGQADAIATEVAAS